MEYRFPVVPPRTTKLSFRVNWLRWEGVRFSMRRRVLRARLEELSATMCRQKRRNVEVALISRRGAGG
jgi:hypothetical protein